MKSLLWAVVPLLSSSLALGAGDVRSERGVLAVDEHAEIRGFNSFELVYQDDGLYFNQAGDVTDRDGAAGASYAGSDAFSVAFNHDVEVSISADQPYYYLASLISPDLASEKERIEGVTDRLAFDGVATTTLSYRSVIDPLVESAGEKALELQSEAQIGDVDDQKAGIYQRVYTVTVAADSI